MYCYCWHTLARLAVSGRKSKWLLHLYKTTKGKTLKCSKLEIVGQVINLISAASQDVIKSNCALLRTSEQTLMKWWAQGRHRVFHRVNSSSEATIRTGLCYSMSRALLKSVGLDINKHQGAVDQSVQRFERRQIVKWLQHQWRRKETRKQRNRIVTEILLQMNINSEEKYPNAKKKKISLQLVAVERLPDSIVPWEGPIQSPTPPCGICF